MKKFVFSVLVLVLALMPAAAMAKSCWYENAYGRHDWEQTNVSMGSCTEDAYYIIECRQCGYNEKHVTHKATGHQWRVDKVISQSTCQSEGSQKMTCTECHKSTTKSIPRKDHTFGAWTETQPATDHSAGIRTRTCSVCDYHQTEEFYPDGTLYRGMEKNEATAMMQSQLIELGILNDVADGIFGGKTEQAVRDFQQQQGLEVTGIAFPQTVTAIDEVLNQPEYPEACIRVVDVNGQETVRCCEIHSALQKAHNEMLEASETDVAMLNAWRLLRTMWQNELDGLYDGWVLSSTNEQLAAVLGDKALFYANLAAQETAWQNQVIEPWSVDQWVTEAIMSQCFDVCAKVNTALNSMYE